MIKKYRVILSNDNRWVTVATGSEQARSAALAKCPDLRLFGVHIAKIEPVEDVAELEQTFATAKAELVGALDDFDKGMKPLAAAVAEAFGSRGVS